MLVVQIRPSKSKFVGSDKGMGEVECRSRERVCEWERGEGRGGSSLMAGEGFDPVADPGFSKNRAVFRFHCFLLLFSLFHSPPFFSSLGRPRVGVGGGGLNRRTPLDPPLEGGREERGRVRKEGWWREGERERGREREREREREGERETEREREREGMRGREKGRGRDRRSRRRRNMREKGKERGGELDGRGERGRERERMREREGKREGGRGGGWG